MEDAVLKDSKTNLSLKKLASASAWVLLTGIVVLVVSGWGITQTGAIYGLTGGLVDRRLANAIHRNANGPLAFFFLLHILINIKLRVSQNSRYAAWLTGIILIVTGACLMAIVVYMEYFRLGG